MRKPRSGGLGVSEATRLWLGLGLGLGLAAASDLHCFAAVPHLVLLAVLTPAALPACLLRTGYVGATGEGFQDSMMSWQRPLGRAHPIFHPTECDQQSLYEI